MLRCAFPLVTAAYEKSTPRFSGSRALPLDLFAKPFRKWLPGRRELQGTETTMWGAGKRIPEARIGDFSGTLPRSEARRRRVGKCPAREGITVSLCPWDLEYRHGSRTGLIDLMIPESGSLKEKRSVLNGSSTGPRMSSTARSRRSATTTSGGGPGSVQRGG